ncbi:MAG: hypothetical protein [Circular genetic element sp.]|nr:MAG: hypothetical protein [Circular genetic element sp.]
MAQSKAGSHSTKLFFEFYPPEGETAGTYFLDIAQCMSIIQRKSFRQGMNYAVSNMNFKYAPLVAPDPLNPVFTSIEVSTVPKTWVTDNATTKAFENWLEQRAEVLKESPSLKSRWSDFKIFLDATHAQMGFAANLIPYYQITNSCGKTGAAYLPGEWDESQFVIPVTGGSGGPGGAQEVTMHVVGDHIPAGAFNNAVTSASLVKSYVDSRARILSPDPVQPPGYNTNMYLRESSHDEMAADIIQNVTNKNDEPPYDVDDYPGGDTNAPVAELVKKMYPTNFGSTTNTRSISLSDSGPFIAPFGLIRIDTCGLSSALDAIILEVDLVPGNYKGLLAERGV